MQPNKTVFVGWMEKYTGNKQVLADLLQVTKRTVVNWSSSNSKVLPNDPDKIRDLIVIFLAYNLLSSKNLGINSYQTGQVKVKSETEVLVDNARELWEATSVSEPFNENWFRAVIEQWEQDGKNIIRPLEERATKQIQKEKEVTASIAGKSSENTLDTTPAKSETDAEVKVDTASSAAIKNPASVGLGTDKSFPLVRLYPYRLYIFISIVILFSFGAGAFFFFSQNVSKPFVEVKDNYIQRNFTQEALLTVTFAGDGKKFFSAGSDGKIRVWELEATSQNKIEATQLKALSEEAKVLRVALSGNGQVFATSNSKGEVKIWELDNTGIPTGKIVNTITTTNTALESIPLSFDGSMLAYETITRSIFIVNVKTGQQMAELKGHTAHVSDMIFTKNGEKLVSGSVDRTVKVWNIARQTEMANLADHANEVFTVMLSPDQKYLATSDKGGTIIVWNFDSLTKLKTLSNHTNGVTGLAFNPNKSSILISGSLDRQILAWNLDEAVPVPAVLGTVESNSNAIDMNSNGIIVTVTDTDKPLIKMWKVQLT